MPKFRHGIGKEPELGGFGSQFRMKQNNTVHATK